MTHEVKQQKRALREWALAETAQFTPGYLQASDRGIFEQVTQMPAFLAAGNIFIYHSVKKEPDTIQIITAALQAGKIVALPYILPGGKMLAKVMRRFGELKPGRWQIPACPATAEEMSLAEIEMMVVPGLVFDRAGYRVGHGGGYYDRFLAGYTGTSVGLCREKLLLDRVPRQAHDIAVDYLATENGVTAKRPMS